MTERDNPGNEKRVTLAQVFLPANILRYGFFLIDTPGVGSSIAANTKAAEAFIPRADAAIVVMSIESPLDQEDWALLEQVRSEVKRVFVVLNKTDLLPESDRENVIGIVSNHLQTLYGNEVPLFPLSARNAVAVLASAPVRQQDSRLQALIEALLTFVQQEKTAQFLSRMAERIQLLIQDEIALEYFGDRQESEKQRLVRRVREKADAAILSGKQQLDALSTAMEQSSTLRSFLEYGQQPVWMPAIWRENIRNSGIQRRAKVQELVPAYATAVECLRDLIRSVEEIVPRELLSGDEGVHQLGVGIGSSEVVLNPVPWSDAERFIASVPTLRRILLRSRWEGHLERLQHDLEDTLKHRIRLLQEEYVQTITRMLERVKSAVSALKSNHGPALAKLGEELREAMRIAGSEQSRADSSRKPTAHQWSAAQGGCFICDHLANIPFHFIRQYQYQLAADPEERARNAGRGGLCAFHTWMYEAISSPQGVCMGYALVPLHFAEQIGACIAQDGNAPVEALRDLARNLLRELGQCVVCDVIEAAESDKMKEVIKNYNSVHSCRVCLPHLSRIALFDPPSKPSHTLSNKCPSSCDGCARTCNSSH